VIHSELRGPFHTLRVSELMSEEIGLQRHVTFPDPRLEGSTAVKCTEADHYIRTTARSDICVLPVCLSLFKSQS